ncbi:IclR family transcriptional regulator C-terminal domain-containing protein [Streptomyces sp. NPDC053741]|uniref:Helix-turn-helix domain-containing protein n=1 Tax=[Kitasatospora] papulosa TaxID=1464011 RepID=A0ABZ1K168_9ACTN|nr:MULTISPECIES: IclR family transcriptional regulator C-terminal domain-containing protein [Streptomyces]MDF9872234.1 DNA-binding IclR family transcriptional regulator [Streptomyces pratensis]MYT55475.1 helix-turn-helix domain-containing protein [Streptomyces sp. SID7834]TPN04651.1 helix-turn-helix domain-containing protein [Mesorhizobium sp. B2-3-3]AGJ55135.1 transcriptional regulator [Streptomyces sp. PAMC 26508]MCX4415773.1 helix-turn-helix domain-containing protein [[Kitasatospora] papulo
MALKPEPKAPFLSVQYALRVLESVSTHGDGVTAARISRETGLPTGHLAPLLLTLRREGYVEQIADGAYVVGPSLLELGSGTARRRALEAKLQQTLVQLRDSVGAAVYVSRYVDGEIRVTQVADGPRTPAVNEWVDFRSAAHASAIGKCLLTQLDRNGRRDHMSRHRIARLTSRTITSEKVLFSKLDSQPATVPVLDLQEYAVGTVCAAVPLTAGSSAGCLALSLPIEHAHRLRAAADTLNRRAAPVLLSLSL